MIKAWPRNKPKTFMRILIEFNTTKNPVTRSVLRDILNNRFSRWEVEFGSATFTVLYALNIDKF